ncbi:efflux RND transporter periplasmic adaptor subunit [Candidatus Aminicenantes bacterium AC-334-K16]|jgi:cobalt-zinc-cadmium efflux system membrane fusion protein|nr:efflux RND transporter periplasmic adaptor subunit [Candidatus Aminicenantes bacterium AC-334-K16]
MKLHIIRPLAKGIKSLKFILIGNIFLVGTLLLVGLSACQSSSSSKTSITSEEDHAHHEEAAVELTPQEMKEFGIETALAGPGKIPLEVYLPGEITVNPNRISHIGPLVTGVAREIHKILGDHVQKGEVLAVLESRELSELKSAYLVARERLALAEITFQREERLWKKKISSEQDYLQAKQALAEARIELQAAEQKLHAVGFREEDLSQLSFHAKTPLARYEVVSPLAGVIIAKHVTLGETVSQNEAIFTVADLKNIWVNLTVYQKDLGKIRPGQKVTIYDDKTGFQDTGQIDWVSPTLEEQTRTATARVVLANLDGKWRPGMFVKAKVKIGEIEAKIAVPRSSVITYEEKPVVFIKEGHEFRPVPVKLGKANEHVVEILAGLKIGQEYVTNNAFTLKAELSKAKFSEHVH